MVYGCLWVAFFLFLLPDLLGVCRVHEVSGGLEGFIGAELYGLLGTIMHDPLWAVDWGLPRNAGLTTMSMIISTLAKSLNQWIYIRYPIFGNLHCQVLGWPTGEWRCWSPLRVVFFGFNLRTWTCTFARRPLRIRPGPRGSTLRIFGKQKGWQRWNFWLKMSIRSSLLLIMVLWLFWERSGTLLILHPCRLQCWCGRGLHRPSHVAAMAVRWDSLHKDDQWSRPINDYHRIP